MVAAEYPCSTETAEESQKVSDVPERHGYSYFRLMRMNIRLIKLLLICQLPLSVSAGTITGNVVWVIDGDTVVNLDTNKVQYKIRLIGIDAPERKRAFGKKSKDKL